MDKCPNVVALRASTRVTSRVRCERGKATWQLPDFNLWLCNDNYCLSWVTHTCACIRDSGPAYFKDVCIFRWPTSLASQTSIRLNVEIWSCHGPELNSVVGASTLQHQSKIPSLSTSAQHPSVENSSELIGWKSISSTKPTSSAENILLKSALYLLTYLLTCYWTWKCRCSFVNFKHA